MNAIDERACGKPGCDNFGKPGLNIVGHGWFVTKSGRRRRYRCTVCGGTLSTNTGTAYRGLRCSRREFDQVASLRVEGVSISATARVTGHSRTTIARWLERAATAAACFNHRLLRDFDVIELQADELCTFIGSKRRTLWLFATIEVCSRLWAGSVLGRRSHRNTKAAINDVILRGRLVGCPLIATDGFEYYVGVMVRLLGSACVYGQVLKTRRNNRVVRVERRVKIGTASRLNAALLASEDSETLNTSFIERLNLTIRQGSAYLRRRSPCHARGADQLRGHVELLRCYYNLKRPQFSWTLIRGESNVQGGGGNGSIEERAGEGVGGTEGARRATGVPADGAAGEAGPLAPGQRWSVGRKRDVVLRLLRGESLEALSREVGVEIYRLEDWRDRAVAGLERGVQARQGDLVAETLDAAKRHIGELSMENELLRERARAAEQRRP